MSEQEPKFIAPERLALTAVQMEELYGHEGGLPIILANHPEIDLRLTEEQQQRIDEIQNRFDKQNG
jgi:hypothetical protein